MTHSTTDLLGVVIAFITVILLLSMLVTALTQMTQAAFRTRGRNLHRALTRLLLTEDHKGRVGSSEVKAKAEVGERGG